MLSRSCVEFNLRLRSFLLLIGIILNSFPPRDIIVSFKFTFQVVIIVQILSITHKLVDPSEGFVLMIDCDLTPKLCLDLLSDEVQDLIEKSNHATDDTQ